MSELQYQSALPVYYRLSGKFSYAGLGLTLITCCVAAIPLSFVYSFASLYSPYLQFNFLFASLFAFALGAFIGQMLKIAKTRNRKVAIAAAILVTSMAYWIAWIAFVYAVIFRGNADLPPAKQIHVSWIELACNPLELLDYIRWIYDEGAYTLNKNPVKGAQLAIAWFGEAALIFSVSPIICIWRMTRFPYCENCQKWGRRRHLLNAASGGEYEIRAALERYDFSVLDQLQRVNSRYDYLEFRFEGCPSCDTMQTLCVNRVTITSNYGIKKTNRQKIVYRLTLARQQFLQLLEAAANRNGQSAATDQPPPQVNDPLAALYNMSDSADAPEPQECPPAQQQQEFRGQDILHDVTIPYIDAIHGTNVEVHLGSPDGVINETLSIKIPPGVEEGSKMRVRDKGQPTPDGRLRGDLIIVLHVTPPSAEGSK